MQRTGIVSVGGPRGPFASTEEPRRTRSAGAQSRGAAGGANEHDAELREQPTRPGEQMLDGAVHRDRDERERGEDRDRIAVNGPEQAGQAVPAEPLAPVDRRLEHRERERRRDEERRDARRRAVPGRSRGGATSRRPSSRSRSRTASAASQSTAAAIAAAASAPTTRGTVTSGPSLVVGERREEHGLRRERVDDRARREHDRDGDERPDREPQTQRQRTWSVKGTVSTLPSGLHCRNSRHVPGAGTRTPTLSFPGVVELPVTLPGRARSCSRSRRARRRGCGSSRGCRWRKKIAWASAPNQGVNVAGLPAGPVTSTVTSFASIAFRCCGAVQREAVAADLLNRRGRRERLRLVGAGDPQLPEELEVRVHAGSRPSPGRRRRRAR